MLLGKEIAFTHFARYADAMIIVTKDKGIFVCDKQDEEIVIYNERQARHHVFDNDYLREELNKLAVIPNEEIAEYQRLLKEKWEKDIERRRKQQEEKEYNDYLRLKEKYEKTSEVKEDEKKS